MEIRILIRVLLVGKPEVGKTCIMLRYIENLFLTNYVQTITVDCRSRANLIQGNFVKICIFDTPGDEELSTLAPAYWHLADIIVFVADFKDTDSFDSIKKYENIIFNEAESLALKIILLNKQDLKENMGKAGNEYEEEVKIWAENQKVKYFSCSAKDNTNVTEPIDLIINEFVSSKVLKKKSVTDSENKKRIKCVIC